ncbi:hypothetical protein C3408_11455 [Candidatus Pantoea alvi]|nr:hypothetical protein C3408_11455 [Pantoea alvi]
MPCCYLVSPDLFRLSPYGKDLDDHFNLLFCRDNHLVLFLIAALLSIAASQVFAARAHAPKSAA